MAVKKSSKAVKKRWFKIVAPAILKESAVGETFLADPEQIINKKMKVSLGTITGEPQKHSIHVNLLVKSYDDGIFKTELLGWRILPAAVKKMIRRNRSKIEDSFVVLAKDGKYIRVKPLIITRTKAQRSVKTALRQKIRTEIAKIFGQRDFKIIAADVLGKRFQHGVARQISKTFPVIIFEIRQLSLVEPDKAKKMNIIKFVGEKKSEKSKPAEKKEKSEKPVERKEKK